MCVQWKVTTTGLLVLEVISAHFLLSKTVDDSLLYDLSLEARWVIQIEVDIPVCSCGDAFYKL